MRTEHVIQEADFYFGEDTELTVALPHTWNAFDGQDGGGDYRRGKGYYRFTLPARTPGKRQFIQFEGANHVAEIFCNGTRLGEHKGGFSTFRFELTKLLTGERDELEVIVDNDAPDTYPQRADFTFYGGLYRPVTFIETEPSHISLMKDGTCGVLITPNPLGTTRVEVFTERPEGLELRVALRDPDGETAAEIVVPAEETSVAELKVERPRLWQGRKDPALYTAVVTLERDGAILDEVSVRYGYRSFHVDVETGFYLNGVSTPLRGVSRHQDREDMGWALTEREHREDMDLICEMGANTIRLAHYQHSQVFYDLCDECGMVVWAEIPFISMFIPTEEARQNTLSQMQELVLQNYNHPSICFWGISNEVTMGGETDSLYRNLREVNALAKALDPTRLTTMAHISMVKPESFHCYITDVQSFNIYQGWYYGEKEENGSLLDEIHAALPDRPVGMSEYGADALVTWHSARPENHDYTEEYQVAYHAELLRCFDERPYLWATHVWNMFDFAADARDEGGSVGRNNKGLVTYDRKIKKDAFYLYKAWWSEEPVLHICGRRFADRAPGERDVLVVTNQPQVTLFVNGEPVSTAEAVDHQAVFADVPFADGENTVRAEAGGLVDEITLKSVSAHNTAYDVPEDAGLAGNWFDEETGEAIVMEYPEGFFSVRDKIGEIMASPQGAAAIMEIMQNMGGFSESDAMKAAGDVDPAASLQMMKNFSFIRLMKMAGESLIKPAQLMQINRILTKIPKPETGE